MTASRFNLGWLVVLALAGACEDSTAASGDASAGDAGNDAALRDGSDHDAAVACSDATDCDDGESCTTDVCDSTGACVHTAVSNDTECDDGDACTGVDSCQAGVCTGADPVMCAAIDQCHDVGVCDPGTGMCSNPPKTDNTGCDDADACTQTDTCQAGVCTGANPVVCSAADECHVVGTCDSDTGNCSNPNATDGTTCMTTGECQAGTCEFPPVVLAVQDFETSPATPTWAFSGSPTYVSGYSDATNAAPANSPLGIDGSRAWETHSVSGGLQLTFDNVAVPSGYDQVRLTFRLAGMNLSGSTGGPDNLDYVLVEISTDGGANYYPRVRVRGSAADNSFWGYDATGVASVSYLPESEEVFERANSGLLADGYSTVEITFPGSVTQVRTRITARSSSDSDTWLIDNVQLIGEYL